MAKHESLSDNGQGDRKRTVEQKPKKVKQHADGQPGEPGNPHNRLDGYTKATEGIRYSHFTHSESMGMVRRVKNELSKRWDIFKPEIDLLLMAALYLQVHPGKMTFNHSDFFDYTAFRTRPAQRRAINKLERMVKNGFLMHVLYKRTHSNGYGITDLGLKVIEAFDEECENQELYYYEKHRHKRNVSECVIYLDRAEELLTRFQEPIFTAMQRQRLAANAV